MSEPASPKIAPGKRLLLDAASRLAAKYSSAQMVSLRELAREAGLNHNTFYRHFDSLEDLLRELVDEFGHELRTGLAQARMAATSKDTLSHEVMNWLLDFALQHCDVFIVSMRERYGPPGPLREAVWHMLAQMEDDILRDLRTKQVLPPLPDAVLQLPLRIIVDQSFQLCLAHIEDPSQKPARLAHAKVVFDTVLMGTVMRLSAA